MNELPLLTVGVVADTHVPDRAASLPPGMLEGLRAAGVGRILHAGDVCTQRVISELSEVAPVSAVGGNRDFTIVPPLPLKFEEEIGGVMVGMVHGHGGMVGYWRDKFSYLVEGYQLARYQHTARLACPSAKVLIFGHTHHPENVWIDGHLFFNPGPSVGFRLGPYNYPPSYGLLHFYPGGQVKGELVKLCCTLLRNGVWEKNAEA
jgi:putative phosphoesterase